MNKLFLIPTPLAENATECVLPSGVVDQITQINTFFVENIKTARRFLSGLKRGIIIDELEFILLDKRSNFDEVLMQLSGLDTSVGVLSEAGCPGVADPGALAVDAAHQLGWEVVPLVGPSSILLALMASGFNGQSFAFHGYLPIDKKDRNKRIRELERAVTTHQQTQIFMETPYRNTQLFESLLEVCHPDTRLSVSVNLTAEDAFSKTRSILSWKGVARPDLHKKPAIFILG
jgi:16S rRNA (cytidine1402-2'-O)-methyltransferase